jgi:hypothetical protein
MSFAGSRYTLKLEDWHFSSEDPTIQRGTRRRDLQHVRDIARELQIFQAS